MKDQIVWLDIPVTVLDRAIIFYSAILAGEVSKQQVEQRSFGVLPHAGTNVSGCLIPSAPEEINHSGMLVYFNVNGRLDDAIAKVTKNGGSIIEEKHAIGAHGFRAIIKDSEGNRIALHSGRE